MFAFFNEILFKPIFNALILIYQFAAFHDLGIAIILLTVAVRLLLFPLFHATARYQKLAPKLQKEIAAIQHRHKDDKGEQTKALMELYRAHKVNPFTPFLSLIVQIPILIALYQVLNKAFKYQPAGLIYPFLAAPAALNTTLLGIVDLSKPNIVIILLAAALQYIQARISLPEHKPGTPLEQAEKISRNMTIIGPIITLVIFWNLSAALGLYWAVFTAVSVIQQFIVNRRLRKDGRIYESLKSIS
jgi:YidC/Oxa1 family membrane protein insertase